MLVTVELSGPATAKSADVTNVKLPFILKRKLLINEGVHNGIFYPKEELIKAMSQHDGLPIYLDHKDAASTWMGEIHAPEWDESQNGIVADLFIVDQQAARNLSFGAKFGVSATVEVNKLPSQSGPVGKDMGFRSYSLVIDPAVKETMLNENQEEEKEMPEEGLEASVEEEAFIKKKKYPMPPGKQYPYPMPDQNKMSEEMAAELERTKKELSEVRARETKAAAEKLAAREIKIGMFKNEELSSRVEELSKLSAETLGQLDKIYTRIEAELSKAPAQTPETSTNKLAKETQKLSAAKPGMDADAGMLDFFRNQERR
jgi:hypothetical protein